MNEDELEEDMDDDEQECAEGTCSEDENPSEEKVGLFKKLANKLSFFTPGN